MLKMKSILTAAVLFLVCGFVMAQPEKPEGDAPGCPGAGPCGGPQMTPPPGGPQGPGCPEMRKERPDDGIFFKAVNATEEQIEKLKPILEAQKNKMKEWREANKEKFEAARKAMQEARESADKEAIAKAKEQMKALGEEGKALREQFTKDIATVLSSEQVELAKKFFQGKAGHRRHEMRGMDKGRDMFKQLGLTDEQKTKMKAIMDEARKNADAAENPQEKREIMEAARKKIDCEVLTDDQKAKLEKMKAEMKPQGPEHRGPDGMPGRPGGMMNPLEGIATPEQMEQARKIMDDAHKQIAEIMKNARKKINDEVLNEEQRKAFQEKMEQFKEQRQMNDRGPGRDGKGMGMRGKMPKRQDPLMCILNDEQKAQAQKILADARVSSKAAKTPDEKREIMKAAREKIKKEILTDEQRKQLEEQRKAKKNPPVTSFADDDEFGPENPEFEPQAPAIDDAEL